MDKLYKLTKTNEEGFPVQAGEYCPEELTLGGEITRFRLRRATPDEMAEWAARKIKGAAEFQRRHNEYDEITGDLFLDAPRPSSPSLDPRFIPAEEDLYVELPDWINNWKFRSYPDSIEPPVFVEIEDEDSRKFRRSFNKNAKPAGYVKAELYFHDHPQPSFSYWWWGPRGGIIRWSGLEPHGINELHVSQVEVGYKQHKSVPIADDHVFEVVKIAMEAGEAKVWRLDGINPDRPGHYIRDYVYEDSQYSYRFCWLKDLRYDSEIGLHRVKGS